MTTFTLERKDAAKDTSSTVVPEQPTQSLIPISLDTYIASLQSALASSKYSLNLQISCCLAVFLQHGGDTRSAKRYLYQVFDKAGWNCASSTATGYKNIARRVYSASLLFKQIGAEKITEAIGGAAEGQLISEISSMLAPMEISSIDNLLAQVGRPRLPAKPVSAPTLPAEATKKEMTGADLIKSSEERIASGAKEPTTVGETAPEAAQTEQPIESMEPGELRLNEPSIAVGTEEPDDELQPRHYMRRSSDFPEAAANDEQFIIVETENIHVSIPIDVDRAELMACIIKMMEIAETLEISAETVTEAVEEAPQGKLQEEMQRVVKTTVKEDATLQAELKNTPEPMKRSGRTSKTTGTIHKVKR